MGDDVTIGYILTLCIITYPYFAVPHLYPHLYPYLYPYFNCQVLILVLIVLIVFISSLICVNLTFCQVDFPLPLTYFDSVKLTFCQLTLSFDYCHFDTLSCNI